MKNLIPILFILVIIQSKCHFWQKKIIKQVGVVKIYSSIPEECNTTKGFKVKTIILANSEEELIQHYGITFLVYFNDGISPILYGSIYYFDPDNHLYCMSLPNKKIAVFRDKKLNQHQNNFVHEICYPIKQCQIFDPEKYIENQL